MAIPADPNDRSLLSGVFIGADDEAYARASDLWSMTGLPQPQDGDFYSTQNADRVYMNNYGLCFSFVYRRPNILTSLAAGLFGMSGAIAAPVFEARKLVDDRILQPLAQVELGPNCCFEIVPGVESVGADKDTVKTLARSLKADKIHFYDPAPEYVGRVRQPDGGEDFHLIVNRRSVKPMSAEALDTGSDTKRQDSVYGGLREQFGDAFAQASGAAFSDALQECARIASLSNNDSHKILHDHWNGVGPQTFRRAQIAESAKNYALTMAG